MRSFCAILVLVGGLVSFQGCGSSNEATKPTVIPASPESMPSSGGAGGAEKAGSNAKPSAM